MNLIYLKVYYLQVRIFDRLLFICSISILLWGDNKNPLKAALGHSSKAGCSTRDFSFLWAILCIILECKRGGYHNLCFNSLGQRSTNCDWPFYPFKVWIPFVPIATHQGAEMGSFDTSNALRWSVNGKESPHPSFCTFCWWLPLGIPTWEYDSILMCYKKMNVVSNELLSCSTR